MAVHAQFVGLGPRLYDHTSQMLAEPTAPTLQQHKDIHLPVEASAGSVWSLRYSNTHTHPPTMPMLNSEEPGWYGATHGWMDAGADTPISACRLIGPAREEITFAVCFISAHAATAEHVRPLCRDKEQTVNLAVGRHSSSRSRAVLSMVGSSVARARALIAASNRETQSHGQARPFPRQSKISHHRSVAEAEEGWSSFISFLNEKVQLGQSCPSGEDYDAPGDPVTTMGRELPMRIMWFATSHTYPSQPHPQCCRIARPAGKKKEAFLSPRY